ncbi:hypothetical protein D3C84_833500 [compost metagenome]
MLFTLFPTLAVYVPPNAGVSVPLDNVKLLKSALPLAPLVTVTVYVFVVPSSAVTNRLIVLLPTPSASNGDAAPLATNDGPLTRAPLPL